MRLALYSRYERLCHRDSQETRECRLKHNLEAFLSRSGLHRPGATVQCITPRIILDCVKSDRRREKCPGTQKRDMKTFKKYRILLFSHCFYHPNHQHLWINESHFTQDLFSLDVHLYYWAQMHITWWILELSLLLNRNIRNSRTWKTVMFYNSTVEPDKSAESGPQTRLQLLVWDSHEMWGWMRKRSSRLSQPHRTKWRKMSQND